jgi:hypothetical protein
MAGKSEDEIEGGTTKAIAPETPLFPVSSPGEVFGCLKYSGKPKSLKEMDAGIDQMVKERHKRGRY